MAKAAWTKRDKTSGEFMAVKKNAKNSKACGAKRLLEATVSGRGHPGPSLDHLRPRGGYRKHRFRFFERRVVA
jgi:hypothetical protein